MREKDVPEKTEQQKSSFYFLVAFRREKDENMQAIFTDEQLLCCLITRPLLKNKRAHHRPILNLLCWCVLIALYTDAN